jgi:hypothetical protein
VGSKLEGIHFDKTGPAAEVKGNYFGRTGVSVSKAVSKVTTGNNFDASTFDGDNRLEADQATVDLSSKITGLAAALNLAAPSGLLANGSTLLSDAKTVPAGITQTSYIGQIFLPTQRSISIIFANVDLKEPGVIVRLLL